MPPSPGRPARRFVVIVGTSEWAEEVERFGAGSPARLAAERERRTLERDGLSPTLLMRCDAEGRDGTRLGGMVKTYVPLGDAPPSERPYGFVFAPRAVDGTIALALVAFGERHPQPGRRSVYERAHKRLHGAYSDERR